MHPHPLALDERFSIRGSLRCDGVGGLLLAERDGRRVAVRWFPPSVAGEEAVLALQRLPLHPALPRVEGSGVESSCVWVSFDFPEGELLDASAALPAERVADLGAALASGLAALHAAGICHGELSAESVLLPRRGGPAMIFDIAMLLASRCTDRRGELSELARLRTTVPYLAPERARGGARTFESDVYSLGAVLCAAGGAGVPVFSAPLELAFRLGSGQYRVEPPRALPDWLRQALADMVSTEPGERANAADSAAAMTLIRAEPQTDPSMPIVEAVLEVDPFEQLLESGRVSAAGRAGGHLPTRNERPRSWSDVKTQPAGEATAPFDEAAVQRRLSSRPTP
ncbi:MAG: protein kinase [Archangiaceae bacterium]|nr:protein kinase [Archangiaceae bacterium]